MAEGWTCKSHRSVYSNKRMTVWEDKVTLPGGEESTYTYVERNQGVLVIPMEEDGSLYLVRQYHYPVRGNSWELPAGSMEEDEDEKATARREIKEEIRRTAKRLERLGEISANAGLCSEKTAVYLATGLERAEEERDKSEQDMVEKTFSQDELRKMVENGQIQEATTLAALLLLQTKRLKP